MSSISWLIAVLPLFVALLTFFNLWVWPRGRTGPLQRRYSALVPARNEAASIEAALRSILSEPVDEVIVYDDQSTDETAAIVSRLAAADERLRLISGADLPDGWVGKPHACHQLSAAATGDVLFFCDADVELKAGALGRLESLFSRYEADAVTAVPRQITGSFVERLIIPLLHLTYVSWLPLPLVWRTSDARFLAANGQLLAVLRSAYDSAGGYEGIKDAVVDDMALCAALKRRGHRVVFADGFEIARCRMYEDAKEVWEGFSKNIFEGIGSRTGVIVAVSLYFGAFVLPWLALPASLVGLTPALLAPSAVGVSANLLQRSVLAARFRHPLVSVLLHPVGVIGLCAIAVNSWLWHAGDRVIWSGRSYAKRDARSG